MKLSKEQQAASEVMNSIISKCWEDEDFKSQLVANPAKAIESFIGKPTNIPEGRKLVVVDQSNDSNIYFNIPAKRNMDDLEMTDEQLEMVAGGGFVDNVRAFINFIDTLGTIIA